MPFGNGIDLGVAHNHGCNTWSVIQNSEDHDHNGGCQLRRIQITTTNIRDGARAIEPFQVGEKSNKQADDPRDGDTNSTSLFGPILSISKGKFDDNKPVNRHHSHGCYRIAEKETNSEHQEPVGCSIVHLQG